jgi:adenine-specific DNA-methyltransferase
MTNVSQLETQRMQVQARLDSQKNAAERNRVGQFATPPALAIEIAKYASELWKTREEKIRFLDPALGTGSFYSALRQVFPARAIAAATGIELDPAFAGAAANLWVSAGLNVVDADFTQCSPPGKDEGFNLILTNPPYVRHHHIGRANKERLQAVVRRDLGSNLSGLAGLYCYFLLLCDRWLADGGLAVWLIPSEFMDVNYGQGLKRYFTQHVKLLHIHRFSPDEVQFDDALVSSAIVVYVKTPPPPQHCVRFTLGGSLLRPKLGQRVSLQRLAKSRKWSTYPQIDQNDGHEPVHRMTLGDLFRIKRGLATGANDFFIVPRERAKQWSTAEQFFKPILPSPRRLTTEVIEAEPDGYPRVEPVLCLIDCDLPESELRNKHRDFWRYLEEGKEGKIHSGYLASRRSPWYSQEKREPAPFLCTYMGRVGNGRKPFRFIWNKSKALASNLYLMLYPRARLRAALGCDPSRYAAVFAGLQRFDTQSFLQESRVYGGGLYKLEPKELARLPADRVLEALPDLDLARRDSLFPDF